MSNYAWNVELADPRPDRGRSAEIVGHETRESFMHATGGRPEVRCLTCVGYADAPDHLNGCPKFERTSNREARAGLRKAFSEPKPVQETDLRRMTQDRMARERSYPILATDAQIRAAMRTGAEQ